MNLYPILSPWASPESRGNTLPLRPFSGITPPIRVLPSDGETRTSSSYRHTFRENPSTSGVTILIFTIKVYKLHGLSKTVDYGIISGIIALLNSYALYVETLALTSPSWYFIPFIIIDTAIISYLILTSAEGKFSAWAIPLLSGTLVLSYISPFGLYDLMPFPYDIIVASVSFFIIHKIAVKFSLPALKIESPINS